MPTFAPESSRIRPAGRVVRVALGALATLVGVAGALAAFMLVADVVATPSVAPTRARAAGAAALGFGIAGLFGAMGSVGLSRVAAGVRGRRGSLGIQLCASRASRNSLLAVALACLGAGLLFAGASLPFRWLALPLLGMAFAAIPVSVLVSAPEQACSFCGTSRRDLRSLLASDAVSVCEDCAQAAMKALAGEAAKRGDALAWCSGLLHLLPEQCPRAISRAFVERLVDKERTGLGLRNAASWALRLGNEPLARELLEELPEAERQPADWLDLGVALADLRRDAEALAATERAAGDVALRPWVLNNAVWFRTQLHPAADGPERARWLAEIEEAERLLEEAGPQGWKESMSWFRGTEAEVRRLSGDLEGALGVLARAEADHLPTGELRVRRAHVLADLGRKDEARAALERALAQLHPEGRAAADARALLSSLPPPEAAANAP